MGSRSCAWNGPHSAWVRLLFGERCRREYGRELRRRLVNPGGRKTTTLLSQSSDLEIRGDDGFDVGERVSWSTSDAEKL